MLPKPPCIKGFVECDPGNTQHTGVNVPPYQSSDSSVTIPPSPSSSQGSVTVPPYQSSETSFTVPPYSSSDRSVTIPPSPSSSRGSFTVPTNQSSSRISFTTSSSRSSNGSSGSTRNNSSSAGSNDLFAVYRVTLRNKTSNPLKGIRLEHGPVPFGATFDPSRSDKSCSFVQKIVGCNQDAASSETKTFPIVYKITNPAFCRISPVLQSIRTIFTDAKAASATVQCTTMKGDELDRELEAKKALDDAKERAFKDPRVVYTVSLKNLGPKALKDLSITHGPIPSGLSFDPTRSDARCNVVQDNVVCMQDLASSKSKEFQITYKVTDGSMCETTPLLQTVKTSEKESIVASTVHCANVENSTTDTGSSLSSSSGTPKEFVAEYTVTLKNLSKNVQNGLLAEHGPVPEEAEFNRTPSSKTCSKIGPTVSCKQALYPAEQKTFKILYGVDSPKDCESFMSLKNVTVTYEGTETTPPVSAWVQCTIRRSDEFSTTEHATDIMQQEYVGNTALPETGHDNRYYISGTEQGVILMKKDAVSDVPYDAFFILAGISILLIGIAVLMKFPQQKGLKQGLYGRF